MSMVQDGQSPEFRRYLARAGGIVGAIIIAGAFTFLVFATMATVLVPILAGALNKTNIGELGFGVRSLRVSYALPVIVGAGLVVLSATLPLVMRLISRVEKPVVIRLDEPRQQELRMLDEIRDMLIKSR